MVANRKKYAVAPSVRKLLLFYWYVYSSLSRVWGNSLVGKKLRNFGGGRHFGSLEITLHITFCLLLPDTGIFSIALKITSIRTCPSYWHFIDKMVGEFSMFTFWRHDACQKRCPCQRGWAACNYCSVHFSL